VKTATIATLLFGMAPFPVLAAQALGSYASDPRSVGIHSGTEQWKEREYSKSRQRVRAEPHATKKSLKAPKNLTPRPSDRR
jgi:hypothetical protein